MMKKFRLLTSLDFTPSATPALAELLKFGPFELGNIAVEYATRKPPSRRSRRSGVLTGNAAVGRVRARVLRPMVNRAMKFYSISC